MKEALARHSLCPSYHLATAVLVSVLICLPSTGFAQEIVRAELAQVSTSSSGLSFKPVQATEGWVLSVSGPQGFYSREEFWGEAPGFSLSASRDSRLPDGAYTWELRPSFVLDTRTRTRLEALRNSGDAAALAELEEELRSSGQLPLTLDVQSGNFRVEGGSIVTSGAQEVSEARATTRDQVILDDLIVDGSLCVGLDCVNGESFGFDTIRLKENNLRIRFVDTSNTASFPSNDWQLTANDSSNGGANKFSIDDIDGGRTPFTIEAGAPSNSLFVEDDGDIGFGTSTPVANLHAVDGNTPTLRLEQDGSSGFTPQTWDVAGNEANFFIRDVTNGSTLPFRIRPGAPTSSIDVSGAGYVGFGTSSPDTRIHVRGTNAGTNESHDAWLLIENASATSGARNMLRLTNNGTSRIVFEDSSSGERWNFSNGAGSFIIAKSGSTGNQFRLFDNGNLTIQGSLTEGSSRSYKTAITPIDVDEILKKARSLPIFEWSYEKSVATRHMGPMAEDFSAAFGLGHDEKSLAPRDVAAVALGAVQGLYDLQQKSDAEKANFQLRLRQLEQERDELLERLQLLEQALRVLLDPEVKGQNQ